jgi:hypothetical protein
MGTDRRVYKIISADPPVLLSSLEKYGLKKESIPVAIGGSLDEFGNRTRLRLELELERDRNNHR